MKNLCYLLLLSFTMIASQSCNDSNPTFEPSLDLEEYVLINFEGTERIYTADNYIHVSHTYQGEEEPYVMINLIPPEGFYTDYFFLEIKNPAVADFDKEELHFEIFDDSASSSHPMISASCNNISCEGNMELTIHEYGEVGGKLIGEFSGMLSSFNEPDNANQSFEGEFVVFIDE